MYVPVFPVPVKNEATFPPLGVFIDIPIEIVPDVTADTFSIVIGGDVLLSGNILRGTIRDVGAVCVTRGEAIRVEKSILYHENPSRERWYPNEYPPNKCQYVPSQ